MSRHDHRTQVDGCYRCELSVDEVTDAGDWYQDDEGVWSKPVGDGSIDLTIYDDEIADWPPLVALRNDNARLRTAIETHRRNANPGNAHNLYLWAALDPDDEVDG